MGKKGSKRKTRWRTLSIGTPPGEEDEEEGLRKDCPRNQEKDASARTFERNGQQTGGYKPRRAGTITTTSTTTSGGSTSGYASSGSRSHRDESTGSPSQPKIIFNEDEYTRITTPRQDVLFKKGYLARKKPWTGNASTSATPSTTESQSASHSTADGSETTEDQQLLDRDSGTGEYPPVVEPGAQLGYGTFYDHASGYYYEYPVMLVGPAPVPGHVGPSVLATVPCGPVPLRPIEWINPAFVPKLANQPYCLMDYQASQGIEPATIVEEQNGMIVAAEASNSVWNESGTGSASGSGSVAGENEEQAEEADNAIVDQHSSGKEQFAEEQLSEEQQYLVEGHQQHLENGMATAVDGPYLDPLLMQEPIHVPHVIPAVPQPYIYPGHYMFGPPLVNVNGVTIQGGPLVRTMDVTAMAMACAKRRKKRKKRKQRRATLGNTEDEEEGEYSSECDNDVSSSRLPWPEGPASAGTTTTTTTITNRPLNPECQEFQLRPIPQSRVLSSPVPTSVVAAATEEVVTSSTNDVPKDVSAGKAEPVSRETEKTMYNDTSIVQGPTNQEAATIPASENVIIAETPSIGSVQVTAVVPKPPRNKNIELNGRTTNHLVADVETIGTNEPVEVKRGTLANRKALSKTNNAVRNNDEPTSADTKRRELLDNNTSNGIDADSLNVVQHCDEALISHEALRETEHPAKARSANPRHHDTTNVNSTTTDINEGKERKEENQSRPRHGNDSSSSTARAATLLVTARKYNSKKGGRFVREPTPGPDLDDATRLDLENGKLGQEPMAVDVADDEKLAGETSNNRGTVNDDEVVASDAHGDVVVDNTKVTSQDATASSNEDSGFESQTRLSEYPITAAVTEWLRRVNSPDLFLTSDSISGDSGTEDEDENENEDEDEDGETKPPKNLRGNPMLALSANSGVNGNVTTLLSHAASCGEFAKTNSTNSNNNNNNNSKNNNNNNDTTKIDQVDADSTLTSTGRRMKDARGMKRKSKTRRTEKRNRSADEKTQSHLVASLVSCDRLGDLVTAVTLRNTPKHNVGDVCESAQEDSVAGMRVASNSRINARRIDVRRARILRRISGGKDPVDDIGIKMRRIHDLSTEEKHREETNGPGKEDRTVSVRTFEKGEIIVSEDGRLLPTSAYEPVPFLVNARGQHDDDPDVRSAAREGCATINEEEVRDKGEMRNNSSENDENEGDTMVSSVSIEEPDVLECWEVETVEPVITPGMLLQSPGVLCDGEAVEEEEEEKEEKKKNENNSETTLEERASKYYRLTRDRNAEAETSEELSSASVISSGRTVPNCLAARKKTADNSERSSYRGSSPEEIPIVMPDENWDVVRAYDRIPVDEAFEVYESCYTGKSPFPGFPDTSVLKQRPLLHGQDAGEGPIPCRAVCCNIQ